MLFIQFYLQKDIVVYYGKILARFKEAAEKMKLTAKDLYDLKVIDKIIKEPIE